MFCTPSQELKEVEILPLSDVVLNIPQPAELFWNLDPMDLNDLIKGCANNIMRQDMVQSIDNP
jgi:hypothetical protein